MHCCEKGDTSKAGAVELSLGLQVVVVAREMFCGNTNDVLRRHGIFGSLSHSSDGVIVAIER